MMAHEWEKGLTYAKPRKGAGRYQYEGIGMYSEVIKKRRGGLVQRALFAMGLFLFSTGALAQDAEGWPSRLQLATGPAGGFADTMGAPWATTVSGALGIALSPEPTTGMARNVQMVSSGTVEIGFTTSDVALEGWQGDGFSDGKQLRNFQTILMFDPNVFQLYTDAESGIYSLSDLAGRVVSPSRAGSGSDIIMRGIVEAFGLEPAKIVNVSPAQANDMMADGQVDAAVGTGNVPHPAALQYAAERPIRVLGFTEQEVDLYLAKHPQLARMVIPAGTYSNQDQEVVSVGSYIMMIANKDMPESLVYELVKTTFDKQNELASAYAAFGRLELESILRSPVPLHPGAVRYFSERGVAISSDLKAPLP